jgi:hypothetical protein
MMIPHEVPTFAGLPRRGAGGSVTALVLWLLVLTGFVVSVAGPLGRLSLGAPSDLASVPCPPTCEATSARPAG